VDAAEQPINALVRIKVTLVSLERTDEMQVVDLQKIERWVRLRS
jgi:hypothetical protein